MKKILHILLLILAGSQLKIYGQCTPNTLAFSGSQPVFNAACGNNSYQVINGSSPSPSGGGQTYRWEVSLNGGAYTTIVNGSNAPITTSDLPKSDITNFVLGTHSNASGDYRIRRVVTDASPSCSSISDPVFLYYASTSATVSGGTISGNPAVCSPATGSLTLTGNTGPVLQWESATTSSGPWTPVSNTTNTLSYTNLNASVCYRALVDNICGGSPGSIDASDNYSSIFCITVNSLPVVSNPLSQIICPGSALTLSVTATSVLTATYQWQKNGVAINGATSSTLNVVSATSTDAGSYNVVVTNACGSVTSNSATVTVNPLATVTVPSNITVCPGGTVSLTNFSSTPSGATYTWTNSNIGIGLATSGSGNVPAFTAINTGTTAISANITVTPILNGCTGTASTYTITVNPLATVSVPLNSIVCAGTTISSSNFSSSPAGSSFIWTNSNTAIGLAASGSGNVPSFTATNSTGGAISSTITVTPIINGCAGTSSNYTITVNTLPVIISAAKTDATACGSTNGSISINATGSAPLEYSIDGGSTFIQNGGNFTSLAAGSYSIAVRNSTGCIISGQTLSISSPGAPQAPAINPFTNPVCEGVSLILSINSPDPSITYTWTGPFGFTATGSSITRTNAVPSMSGNYAVTATNGTCVSTSTIFSITVSSAPVVTVPPDLTYCEGVLIPASNFNSTPSGATYTWTNSNPAIGLPDSGSGNIPAFTAVNTTLAVITATIIVTPILNGCLGQAVSYTVTINPLPTVVVPANLTYCPGNSIPASSFSSNISGVSYTWTNSNTSIGLAASGSGNIPALVAVNTATTITATITVTPTLNGCQGQPVSYTITVNPIPLSPTAPGITICSEGIATLTATFPGGTYQWYDSASGGNLLTTGSTFTTQALTITTTYYVQTIINGCISARTAVTVNVNQTPGAPAVSAATICSGSTAILTATAPGGTYQWYDAFSGGNFLATGATYTTPALIATTTYYVQTTVNGCTSARSAVTVTVVPLPAAPAVSGTSTCSGTISTLTASGATGTYQWYDSASGGALLGTGTAYITPALTATTTYYVQTTVNGCESARTAATVTIIPIIDPEFKYSSGTYCKSGITITPPPIIYISGGGTFSAPPGLVFVNTSTGEIDILASAVGTYLVTFINNSPCPRSTTANVTITNAPDARFSYNTAAFCQLNTNPLPIFPAVSSAGVFSASPSGLVFFNTSTGEINLETSQPGTYTIINTIAAGGGCSTTSATFTVTINPAPVLPTVLVAPICAGDAAILTAIGPGGNYQWYDAASGGNLLGSADTYTTSVLTTTKTYYVQVTVNGCTSERTAVTVVVNPIPSAPAVSDAIICTGSATTLTATFPGGTYLWYDAASGGNLLGTGAAYSTPVLTATTIYYVETTVNGCTSARTAVTVTINPIPAAPSASGITICSGITAILTATAPGGTYQWYDAAFGGNLLATGSTYTTQVLTANTTYYVQTMVNGCTSARTPVTVSVTPTPAAPIIASATICSGSIATLTATAPGGTYQWYNAASGGTLLGTGIAYTSPVLTATTTYYVQKTVNGCTSPRTAVTVTVTPLPAAPIASGVATCPGTISTLTAIGSGRTYQWYNAASGGALLGTGADYITPVLTATTTYYVQTIVNGCTSTRTAVTVTIIPLVDPEFKYSSGTYCKSGIAITPPPVIYTPGGGTFSAPAGLVFANTSTGEIDVLASAVGTYQVTFINNSPCPRATTANVTITYAPDASFIFSGPYCQQGSNPLPVFPSGSSAGVFSASPAGLVFFNTSTGEINMGASIPGTYVVKNTIAANGGCAVASATYIVTINPIPALPTVLPAAVCSGTSATLTATGPGGNYQWYDAATGGNFLGTGAIYTSPILTANTIYYIQTTVNGCTSARAAIVVTVNPIPAAPIASGTTICTGSGTTLTASGQAVTYQWYDAASGGNLLGTGSAYSTPVLIATTIYYVETIVNNCISSRTAVTVTVNPIPAAPAASGIIICSGNSATLSATAPGGTYQWYDAAFGGNLLATGSYSTAVLTATTTYYVQTIVNGCISARTPVTVIVIPTPQAPAIYSNSPVCSGSFINLSTAGITGASYSWTGPNGFTSNLQNPVINAATKANAGLYRVTVTVNGCTSSPGSATVFVNEPAIVSAGKNQRVCVTAGAIPLAGTISGDGSAGVWSSSGSGKFLPSNTNLKAIYIPSVADTATSEVVLSLTSINNTGCSESVSSMVITFMKLPIVNAGADQYVCANTTISLNGKVMNAGGGVWSSSGSGKFSPSNTSLNAIYIPSQSDMGAGSVIITLSSIGSSSICNQATDKINVTFIPAITVNAGPDLLIPEKATAVLNPEINDLNVQYLWTPNINLSNNRIKNPVVTARNDQVYTLRITNSQGCVTEDEIFVKVLKPIVIPNTFTPNGDGVNDIWTIEHLVDYKDATMYIYNRYGIKIYSSINYTQPWDGTYNGKLMPAGTYYYLIKTKFPEQIFSGPISIFR